MEIIKLKGVTKNYLWGGKRLTEYGKNSDDIMAESWELSTHRDGPSIVDSGEHKGLDLRDYFKLYPEYLGDYNDLPIMIKYIDAKEQLSIQVHPNDEYALRVENQSGKTEMCYIIDALPGSFIYFGVNKEITKEELKERIQNNTILEVLNKVETKKGDSFLIEAGTIHAFGAGNLIWEVEENSNLTYRLYDYNRKDKNGNLRPLHIDKAFDVVKTTPNIQKTQYKNGMLCSCDCFDVERFVLDGELTLLASSNFHVINFLSGEGKIENIPFKKGDTFFIPANYGEYKVSGKCELLQTSAN